MKILLVILLFLQFSNARSETQDVTQKECIESIEGQCPDVSSTTSKNNGETEADKTSFTWDCLQDEVANEQSLLSLKGMLTNGEKEISGNNHFIKDAILVLGNAGAGKTTFTQFLAGDNTKLISKEVSVDSGTYTIEDRNKIGSSVTESFTVYPESITTSSNITFIDTPGFRDTRSNKHEILESYAMKKYLKGIKNIKTVLIITYHSLERGVYKDDFVNMLRNLHNFIRNINKYKNSIAIIATKVPNTYKISQDKVTLVSDSKIISNIAEYLIDVKTSLNDKLSEPNNEANDVIFFQNAIEIIESLLEKDQDLNYKKINIFRRPSESGSLSEMPSFQKAKESLNKTLENIVYSEILEDDISYTLSNRAKNYLDCLLWYINKKISTKSTHTFQLLDYHYQEELKNYTDIYEVYLKLEKLTERLKLLKNGLKSSQNYEIFSSILDRYIVNENIHFNRIDNTTFYDNELFEYTSYFQNFVNTSMILSPITWSEQMTNLTKNIKLNLSWYKFLITSYEYYSDYKIQNIKKNIMNDDPLKEILKIHDLLDNSTESYFAMLQDSNKKKELDDMIALTLKQSNNITSDENGKLVIQGYYITFSEIKDFMINHYNSSEIKIICIQAIHTVFIDADFNDDYYRGIDIMIAAPNWEIIGKRIINIDGIDGKEHENSTAKDGERYGEKGKDGLPGLPGGNGGNFLGIGLCFINLINLIITAIGGKGGPGQNGGFGYDGKAGADGLIKFYNITPNDKNFNEKWLHGTTEFPFADDRWMNKAFNETKLKHLTCKQEILIYSHEGECGFNGSSGGNGGVGGIGGEGGNINIIKEESPTKFLVQNSKGISGSPGEGGTQGKPGKKGVSNICFKMRMHDEKYLNSSTSFWICKNYVNQTINCNYATNLNGLPDHNTVGIKTPSEIQVHDFCNDIYEYKSLLERNEGNKFLLRIINKQLKLLYKKYFYRKYFSCNGDPL